MKKRDKTICLNMIVKNESHIIVETLDHLHKIFDFDYWVISDTGSTDNTQGIIKDYFKDKGVPGELVENEWKWFGESRTDALKAAYNKTDYLLIFDADDKFHGNLVLPDTLNADSYCLKFKSGITYFRPLLINNRKKWKFKGVIHEVLSNIDPVNPSVYLDNEEYFVESRRLGNFNLDPLKYQKQAKVLEDAFYKEMDLKEDIGLANRYAFYCARSYRDAGDNDNAIIWFKKVINELDNWYQEKYCSCIEIGDLFADKNDLENSLMYYLKSVEFDDERIEGIVKAINLSFSKKLNMLAISLYNQYKNYNHNIDTSNRLFIEEWFYRQFEMDFRVSIQTYNIKGQEKVGYEACKKIINNKKYEHHTYIQTVWNLSLPNYKKCILLDTKDEITILQESLSEYIIHLDSKNFKEKDKNNWNVFVDLWIYINNFNNLESDLTNKVKGIIEYSELSLKEVSDMMYDYTFKTHEHHLSIALYNKYRDIKVNNENKQYYYKLRHLVNISASYANNKKIGYECCKELIINNIEHDRNNIVYNLQFYIKEIDNDSNEDKVKLLEALLIHRNKIKSDNHSFGETIWNYSREYILKYAPHLIDNIHKTETAKNSNKILIYTGYSGKLWNYTTAINSALGGSEKAVAFMSKELPSEYEIYISGDVQDEKVDNITYVNRSKLNSLLESTEFHTIIISRYVSFFVLYPVFKCHKLIISAHDTIFLNNSPINTLSTTDILHKYMDIIDYIVVLTDWHKNNISYVHNIRDHSKFRIINNGIITKGISDELEYTSKKIKNSFIYTSRPERGLERLLELWPSILEKMSDATLNIATYEKFPVTDQEKKLDMLIKKYDSIKFLGQLNESELNSLRSKSEYWLYPTCFTETSCITSLEMLLSEVICIYYPLAGLTDTLGSYGIQVTPGDEISTILGLDDNHKKDLKIKGKQYALSCSWKHRAIEWNKLINKYIPKIENPINNLVIQPKILSLKDISNIMYNYTFKTNEHRQSIELFKKYMKYKENKEDYFKIRYLASISASYTGDIKIGYECCKELIINEYQYDKDNIFYNMSFYMKEIENDNEEERKLLLEKIYLALFVFKNKQLYIIVKQYSLHYLLEYNIDCVFNKNFYGKLISDEDIKKIDELRTTSEIKYDFAILKYNKHNISSRVQKVLNNLNELGFTVNTIDISNNDYKQEMLKCKIILNIYDDENEKYFIHILFDDILSCNFNILSEISSNLFEGFVNTYNNIKFISYNTFFDNIVLHNFLNNFNTTEGQVLKELNNVIHMPNFKGLSLRQVNQMMNFCIFSNNDHNFSNTMYDAYKKVKLSENNRYHYYRIRYLESISACYVNNIKNGYDCCKSLIINDIDIDRNNVFYNMRIYISEINNDSDNERKILLDKIYIHKVKMEFENPTFSAQLWEMYKDYIQKYHPDLWNVTQKKNKVESAKTSNKILFYTGFMYYPWNYTYAINNALGGAEKAVAFISKEFPSNYEIYVSGDVEEEKVDNVTYINRHNLHKLIETTEFHTIIISRYVSFFNLYPNFKCHKLILSAHDVHFLYNLYNTPFNASDMLFKYYKSIDKIITLTEWHKNAVIGNYKPINSEKFEKINNGILTKGYLPELEFTNKKVKNSFVFTSKPDRGLDRILEIWPSILEKMPDATLNVAIYGKFPESDYEAQIEKQMKQYSNIKYVGQLNERDLRDLLSISEFWLYPNWRTETSCITALEMLISEVICIYFPLNGLTGLNDTLGSYGVTSEKGKELDTILSITEGQKISLRTNGKEYALRCSWKNRANRLIEFISN